MFRRSGNEFDVMGLLILALFGTLVWQSDPLNSQRPPSDLQLSNHAPGGERIPARLWEDPFAAAHRHRLKSTDQGPNSARDCASESDCATRDRRVPASFAAPSSHPLSVRVIAVTIPEENFAEHVERRIRRRFALVAALHEQGYEPETPNYIGELVFGENGPGVPPLFEWYRNQATPPAAANADESNTVSTRVTAGSADAILLIWMSELYCKTLSTRLQEIETMLQRDLALDETRIDTVVVGPTFSSCLAELTAAAPANHDLATTRKPRLLLSPSATLPAASLPGLPAEQAEQAEEWLIGTLEQRYGFKFVRTLVSDEPLVSGLADELVTRRYFNPGSDYLAIISESDTEYGRSMPKILASRLRQLALERESESKTESHGPAKIISMRYLRGIDGRDSSASKANNGPRATPADKSNALSADPNFPVGESQYDYLRRLADRIASMDRTLRARGEHGGVKAVAILGSDVYDKLLILRALRKRLPAAIFMTTDLDARLFHPDEYRWARNLVVASRYGLDLWQESFSNETPPFRDAYQTSVFIAARLAAAIRPLYENDALDEDVNVKLGQLRLELQELSRPKIYEIGRSGPVLLGQTPRAACELCAPMVPQQPIYPWIRVFLGETSTISGASSEFALAKGVTPKAILLIVGCILVFAYGIYRLTPSMRNTRARSLWAASLLLATTLVAWLGYCDGGNGELFLISEGVSVWPTQVLTTAVSVLTLYFIYIAHSGLRENRAALANRYPALEIPPCHPATAPEYYYLKLSLILLAIAIAMGYTIRNLSVSNIALIAVIWSLLIVLVHAWCRRQADCLGLRAWWHAPMPDSDAGLWVEYCRNTPFHFRAGRVLRLTVVYMGLTAIVFSVFGEIDFPGRGDVARYVYYANTLVGGLAMLFLLFYVADASVLCVLWMKKWRELIFNRTQRESHAPSHKIDERKLWYEISVLAERTQEVGQLIYYPFIVIFLGLIARSSYFDNWGLSQRVAIVLAFNIVVVVYCALKLRSEAERIRAQAIDCLNDKLIAGGGDYQTQDKESIKQVISLLRELRVGAFRAWGSQPFVRVSLMLLAMTGVSVAEYVSLLY